MPSQPIPKPPEHDMSPRLVAALLETRLLIKAVREVVLKAPRVEAGGHGPS
jgi:hypothetical protein